jgi:dephospho-CoA kinase
MRIGLTGGIGSGKSSVAAMFATRGAAIIDTDAIARRLTSADGAAMPALQRAFGATMVRADGALDREAMRALAFADPAAKKLLEALLHPLIDEHALREAAAVSGTCVVFDVPLLAESLRWRERVDRVLVVDCSELTQVGRVARRAGWTRDAAERVIASQAGRDTRRAIADAVIFNDTIDLEQLDAAVAFVWSLWHTSGTDAVEQ